MRINIHIMRIQWVEKSCRSILGRLAANISRNGVLAISVLVISHKIDVSITLISSIINSRCPISNIAYIKMGVCACVVVCAHLGIGRPRKGHL